jgi:hypothetical protein
VRSHQQVFDEIYQTERWGRGAGSGSGSRPSYSAGWLTFLRENIPQGACVLDLGCGDHQLYEGFDLGWWDYHGADVSSVALDLARGRGYSGNLHQLSAQDAGAVLKFCAEHGVQYVLLKDVLMHWTDAEIHAVLPVVCAGFAGTIYTANNWRYIRGGGRPVMPRQLDRYSWAPVPPEHPDLIACGFKERGYYARRIKLIMERPAPPAP